MGAILHVVMTMLFTTMTFSDRRKHYSAQAFELVEQMKQRQYSSTTHVSLQSKKAMHENSLMAENIAQILVREDTARTDFDDKKHCTENNNNNTLYKKMHKQIFMRENAA